MSVDDAASTLNRLIKDYRALNRLQDVIAVAKQYEEFERTVAERKRTAEAELAQIAVRVDDAVAAFDAKKARLEAERDAFDAALHERRDRAERDCNKHLNDLTVRRSAAESAAATAEVEAKRRIAEVTSAATRFAASHEQEMKERRAELAMLEDRVKMTRREIEGLRSKLGG